MPATATEPRIAIGGHRTHRVAGDSEPDWVGDAIRAGGGVPVEAGQAADGLVWLSSSHTDELAALLTDHPELRWVQLPFAGIERFADAGVLDPSRTWTCAKGSFAEPVAEHALGLAIAGLRGFADRFQATSWGAPAGTSLYDADVTILGGGGITDALLRLLTPMRVRATVVRRSAHPTDLAARTVTTDDLDSVLPGALVVFVALALTPETIGIIGARQLELMDERAWLVNVARGPHVDTDALVDAVATGVIAGAALDVTDPEPLPDGHPLWKQPNCLITPHSADTWEMVQPRLARRISTNVGLFRAGDPLEGLVDTSAGY